MVPGFASARMGVSPRRVGGGHAGHVDPREAGRTYVVRRIWRGMGEVAFNDTAVYALAFLIRKEKSTTCYFAIPGLSLRLIYVLCA